jgi:hypothetical protein
MPIAAAMSAVALFVISAAKLLSVVAAAQSNEACRQKGYRLTH